MKFLSAVVKQFHNIHTRNNFWCISVLTKFSYCKMTTSFHGMLSCGQQLVVVLGKVAQYLFNRNEHLLLIEVEY